MISWRGLLASGVMLLALTSCQSEKSVNQIAKETKNSIVLITYGDKKGHGSGFFIEAKGTCAVLTAAHVLAPSKKIKLTSPDQKLFSAARVQTLPNLDLAVITFQPNEGQDCPYNPLQLGDSNQVEIGDRIVMVGYPTREGAERLVLQFPNGEITQVEEPPLPEGYAISYDVTTVGGMSGAPVLDETGKVIAIHGMTDAEIVGLARIQQSSLSEEQKNKVEEINERAQSVVRINHFKWGIPIQIYLDNQLYIATNSSFLNTWEQSVYYQVNQYRQSRQLNSLRLDSRISKQARIHSENMAAGRVPFSKEGVEEIVKITAAEIPSNKVAVHIAVVRGYTNPATKAVQGWIDNASIHKDIIGQFDLIGVGVVKNDAGQIYFTVIAVKRHRIF